MIIAALGWEFFSQESLCRRGKSLMLVILKWSLVGCGWEDWFCWNLVVTWWNCNELITTRQKQYFEQRKRQQQNLQMIGSDNCFDGQGISGQTLKEQRSLDILNLLNLSTNPQQCNPFCPNGMHLIFFPNSSFIAAVSLQVWKARFVKHYFYCSTYWLIRLLILILWAL